MRRAARATGPKRCLRAVRLEPRDQFHQFHRRHRIPGEYQQRCAAQKRDRFEITEQIVLQCVDGAVHDMCTPVAAAECITVWRSTPDPGNSKTPGGTCRVFNDDGLSERCPHVLGQDTHSRVRRTARCVPDDNRDRPCRIGLRPGDPRHSRERGNARGQVQKLSTGKFHFDPSLSWSVYSITSSAPASSVGGTSMPSALAVCEIFSSDLRVYLRPSDRTRRSNPRIRALKKVNPSYISELERQIRIIQPLVVASAL